MTALIDDNLFLIYFYLFIILLKKKYKIFIFLLHKNEKRYINLHVHLQSICNSNRVLFPFEACSLISLQYLINLIYSCKLGCFTEKARRIFSLSFQWDFHKGCIYTYSRESLSVELYASFASCLFFSFFDIF